jgi:chromosome segregation ATPase
VRSLVEAIKIARQRRALFFQIRSQERKLDKLMEEFDVNRLSLQYDSLGVRRPGGSLDCDDELEDDTNEAKEEIEENTARLRRDRAELRQCEADLDRRMDHLYGLESDIVNASFRRMLNSFLLCFGVASDF